MRNRNDSHTIHLSNKALNKALGSGILLCPHLELRSILIREEDEARLSPLQYGHINVLGHYSFVLSEKIM